MYELSASQRLAQPAAYQAAQQRGINRLDKKRHSLA